MNVVEIIKKTREIEKQYCKENCEYFIENYVHIEDRDSPELAVPFHLWEGQKKTLRSFIAERLNIVLKARQLGLTWLALAYAVWCMVFRAGFSVVALSKKEDDAKELVRRIGFILRHLPQWLIRHKKDTKEGVTWDDTALTVTIYHPDKEPSTFVSMSAAPDSGRSFTANLVIIDEWAFQQWAKEIWSAAYPTINRPTGGQVIGLSTGKRGTLFEELWNAAKAGINGFKTIFLNWKTDPRRTQEWYEQTKKDLPHSYRAEYPTNEEDAWTVGEGAFFEEWDEEIHVPYDYFDPPKSWAIIGAYDPGFASYACFKWYAVSPDGWAICFKEYYPHRTTDEEQAKEIKRMSVYEDGTPMHLEYIWADTDAWTPSRDSGQSTAEIFMRHGIRLSPATKDLENGWRRLHEWLKPFDGPDGKKMAMLRFTKNCRNTIRTYPACECSKTNPEDISRDSEHHPQDCDRYFVMSRPRPNIIESPKKELPWMFRSPNENQGGSFIEW